MKERNEVSAWIHAINQIYIMPQTPTRDVWKHVLRETWTPHQVFLNQPIGEQP